MATIEELRERQKEFAELRPPKPVTDNLVADSLLGVAAGVEGLGRETLGLAGRAVDFVGESVGVDLFDDGDLEAFQEGTSFGERGTALGKFVQGTTEFVAGFFPALGAVGRVSKLGKFVNSTIAGALVDSVVAEDDERLSNFARDLGIENVVTDYLANDGDESELEGRLKNVLEGVLGGSILDGAGRLAGWAFGAIKAHKAGRKVIQEAVSEARTQKEAAGEVFDEVAEQKAVAGASEEAEAAVQRTLAQEIRPEPQAQPKAAPKLEEVGLDVDLETVKKDLPTFAENLSRQRNVNPRDLSDAELLAYGLKERGDLNPEAFRFKEDGAEELVNAVSATFRQLEDIPGKRPVRDPEMAQRVMKRLGDIAGQSPQEIELAFRATNANLNDMVDQALAGQVVLEMTGDSLARKIAAVNSGEDGAKSLVDLAADLTFFTNLMGHVGGIRSNVGRLMRGFQGRFQNFAGLDQLELENFQDILADMGGREALLRQTRKLNEMIKRANGDAAMGIAQAAKGTRPELAWAMGTEYFIGNLLSGPLTASTNFISSAAFALFRPVEAAAGAVGAALRGNSEAHLREAAKRIREVRTMFSLQDSVRHAARTFFESFKASETESLFRPGGANLLEAVDQEGSINVSNALKVITGDDKWARENPELAAQFDWIGKAFRMPGRILKSTDDAIKTWVARSHATARLWDEVLEEGAADVGAEVARRVDKVFVDGALLTEQSLARRVSQSMADAGLTGEAWGREFRRRMGLALEEESSSIGLARELQFQAETSTFTRRGVKPGGGRTIDQTLNQFRRNHPWANLFIPFVTTPLNLAREAGTRAGAPVLAASGIFRSVFIPDSLPALKEVHGNFLGDLYSQDPARVAEASGKLVTAIGITSLVGSGFIAGRISGGGPASKAEREIKEAAGWRPYSIRIGDTWYSYHRMDPFASTMGVIADFADAYQRSGEDGEGPGQQLLVGIASGITRNITSKTYLQGLSNLVRILEDPEGQVNRFTGSIVGGLTPLGSLGRNVNRAIDPVDRDLRTWVDQFWDRVPGMSRTLPPQRNLLGEVVDRPRSLLSGPTAGLANMVLPFAYENVSDSPIKRELESIGYGFTPPRANVNGLSLHDFRKGDQTAYDRWLELHGEVRLKGIDMKGALRRLINSSSYKRLSPEGTLDVPESPRVAEIKRVIRRYRAEAKEQMLREFPELRGETERISRERYRLKRGLF